MQNYFEMYGLPISFNPDQALVKRKYYALSKQYHPDFFVNESQEKQEEVLRLSTENTKAYQVLSNSERITAYILNLYNLLPEGESYTLPQSFLMEMMEVNEELMELQFEPNDARLVQVKATLDSLQKRLAEEMLSYTDDFENADNHQKEVKLVKIKDLYYRAKYLARLNETISKLD